MWTWWAIVLLAVLVWFLIAEGIALKLPAKGDTLSETVWYPRDQGRWLYWLILEVVFASMVTMAWLLVHFRWQGGRFSL